MVEFTLVVLFMFLVITSVVLFLSSIKAYDKWADLRFMLGFFGGMSCILIALFFMLRN